MAAEPQVTLRKNLAKLSAKERIIFPRRELEDLTIGETAKILRLSTPAVKSRLWRAGLALREKLNPYFGVASATPEPPASALAAD